MYFINCFERITAEGGVADSLYIAVGALYFESIEKYENAFGPHTKFILDDVKNYTDSTPILHISDVTLA